LVNLFFKQKEKGEEKNLLVFDAGDSMSKLNYFLPKFNFATNKSNCRMWFGKYVMGVELFLIISYYVTFLMHFLND
jgi:hypothetical protein